MSMMVIVWIMATGRHGTEAIFHLCHHVGAEILWTQWGGGTVQGQFASGLGSIHSMRKKRAGSNGGERWKRGREEKEKV